MLLQHGESKGQPANAASHYWKKERERGEEREKGEKSEMEHIFVTYLPIGWVQTNKMEKVKVILRDEWISLDIYLQWRYSKSSAWLITVTLKSMHSQITFADVFFPPFHHIILILHMRAEWLHMAGFSVMSCPRKECVSGHLKGYSCVSLPFFDPFHQLK